jgi:hypothetical protein
VDNFDYELAAAGVDELLLEVLPSFEPEFELDEESDPDELDAPDELDESDEDDDEPVDSLLLAEPLGELATVLLALSRLSLR